MAVYKIACNVFSTKVIVHTYMQHGSVVEGGVDWDW
jgi:hypothetical protein